MVKAAAKAKGREVARVEKPRGNTGVVTADAAARMRKDAAKIAHGFTSKDFAVPFIRIVEKTSELRKKTSADYNADAEDGDIYNSATDTLTSGQDGIYVIPCAYVRKFTRWGLPDSKDRGFKADLGTDYDVTENCTQNDKGLWIWNENPKEHVVESGDYFLLEVNPSKGTFMQAIISMSSSRWASAKKWNALIDMLRYEEEGEEPFNPPMFGACYRLTTAPKNNDSGEWFIWVTEFESFTLKMKNGEALYDAGMAFAELALKGKVKIAERTADESAAEDEEAEVPPSARNKNRNKR